jgi:hypothetical protein
MMMQCTSLLPPETPVGQKHGTYLSRKVVLDKATLMEGAWQLSMCLSRLDTLI